MKTQKDLEKKRRKGVKVVYISSPMKVKTSASEFRALVQELTGINSDAERFMEINGVGSNSSSPSHSHDRLHHQQPDQRLRVKTEDHLSYVSMVNTSDLFDFPATISSDYLSLLPSQTFGNDQYF
ncbi:sigma factor binding protein 1, chloroplastic-like [Humulus lupulus]|uniref:sigma factor binding protein 1, chloroplastic-like n=1 Tax=Humulus lupulus TaxID=3486 RepID=UPI002B40D67E|nr:sigma factor binding protein 1, chloroplastic-like [Humulus lupulus]